MGVSAVVLAAGSANRFGADKVEIPLRGKPLWLWSFEALRGHPDIDSVGVVCGAGKAARYRSLAANAAFVVEGGSSRVESARIGVAQLDANCQIVLIHDAARPFVHSEVVDRVIQAVERSGAAAPAIETVDTVRQIGESGLPERLDRRNIRLMQTPQGARVELLKQALDAPHSHESTDEMGMLERIGVQPELVEGHPESFKVTLPEDLRRVASCLEPPETRTGIGFDIHRFSLDMQRPMVLGGVRFPNQVGLEGHSDADVLSHAIVDALLGAASMGDIGVHFPCDDDRWRDASSILFLQHAAKLLAESGWRIRNIDATLIAEQPKVMPRAEEIRKSVAAALGTEYERVSLKATTNEKLGSIGRGEGVSAFAVATIVQHP